MTINSNRTLMKLNDLDSGTPFIVPNEVDTIYIYIQDSFNESYSHRVLKISNKNRRMSNLPGFNTTVLNVKDEKEESLTLHGQLTVEVVDLDLEISTLTDVDE